MRGLSIVLLTLAAAPLATCTSQQSGTPGKSPASPRHGGAIVRGAGATSPQPVLARWGILFQEKTGIQLSYDPVGSEAGLEAVSRGTVAFGVTMRPLDDEVLDEKGLVQFPFVIVAIVPVVNLPGIEAGGLRLTADLLTGIYLGTITHWNDPALREVNPDLPLPDTEIIPVHRSEDSGAFFLLRRYLAAGSDLWRQQVGETGTAEWPGGVTAASNQQMARFIGQFKNTLGYVEFTFANKTGLTWTRLRNAAGKDVLPAIGAFGDTAARAEWEATHKMHLDLNDTGIAEGWPMVGAAYALMPAAPNRPGQALHALQFFHWALTDGATAAATQYCIALPGHLCRKIQQIWLRIMHNGQPLWTAATENDSRETPDSKTSPRDSGEPSSVEP